MKLKIICWNVRGVNNSDKRKVMKKFEGKNSGETQTLILFL